MAKRAKKRDGSDVPMGKPRRRVAKAKTAAENPRAVAGDNNPEASKIECFNRYRDLLKPLKARLATVQSQIADVYLDAKKDKLPKKLFTIAENLTGTRKQEEKVIAGVKDVRFVALALGLPIAAQLDMFADAANSSGALTQSAEAQGGQAFRDGAAAKPPYAPGTTDYDEWMAGFYAEQDKKVQGFKPLNGEKPKGGRKAKAAEEDDTPLPTDGWGDDDADPARPLQ